MNEIFLQILNMSISASWVILAVMLIRLFLKKAPRFLTGILWALVGIRLCIPSFPKSRFSIVPSSETLPDQIITGPSFSVSTGVEAVDHRVNAFLGDRYFEGVSVAADSGARAIGLLAAVWLIGISVMLAYMVISYFRFRRDVRVNVTLSGNILLCDHIPAPFILGILRPRICLPSDIDPQDAEYVIAHEKAHLKRRDHWSKPIGFLILTLHWFNPLVWISYHLFCRDVELACDELVIRDMNGAEKKAYSAALLSCSLFHRFSGGSPLAFGEVGVKARIRSVLKYKRPAVSVTAAAIVLCVIMAGCFVTDPVGQPLAELEREDFDWIRVVSQDSSYELTSESSVIYILDLLSQTEIGRTSLSWNRSPERFSEHSIHIFSDNGNYCTYYFNHDCSQVWWDNGVKPSLTHRVLDPEPVYQFFCSRPETQASAAEDRALNAAVSQAVMDKYCQTDGDLITVTSHHIFSTQGNPEETESITVYLVALYETFDTTEIWSNGFAPRGGGRIPTALTFSVDADGNYFLEEYWEARDGSYFTEDIKDKFPDGGTAYFSYEKDGSNELHLENISQLLSILDGQGLVDLNIETLLNTVCSSPIYSSLPHDYIQEHRAEYEMLLAAGGYTLRYCYSLFLVGGQTETKGQIMALICQTIAESWKDPLAVDDRFLTDGQMWFDSFQTEAEALAEIYTAEELNIRHPACAFLLSMYSNDIEHTELPQNEITEFNPGYWPVNQYTESIPRPEGGTVHSALLNEAEKYCYVEITGMTEDEFFSFLSILEGAGFVKTASATEKSGTNHSYNYLYSGTEVNVSVSYSGDTLVLSAILPQ